MIAALFFTSLQIDAEELPDLESNTHSHLSNIQSFKSDVIGVTEKMLNPMYWQSNIDKSNIEILNETQISINNEHLFSENPLMNDMLNFSTSLTRSQISKQIKKISKSAKSTRYYSDGKQVTEKNYKSYENAINLAAIPNQQRIKLGMVVRRTNMRTFPTEDKIFKTTQSIDLDRFQETALFPTEVVAVLHESVDKKWWFVTSYNYSAWVKKVDIAIGTRCEISAYKKQDSFLVVTGSKIFTSYNPQDSNVSEVQLEMGTVIPLTHYDDIPVTLGGQNTYASYVVSLPTRDMHGNLQFKNALISRATDVNQGFLPYTRENILAQAFKFLGERYGWGHSFNARDCTGFVGEVYKSFGILMPRNSGDQGKSLQGINTRFLKSASTEDKLAFIKNLDVGDLIYIPGHVMMVVGYHDEQPYIIHDVSGFSYFKENGDFYKSQLNGVSMTPLLPLQLSRKSSYLDKIYNIKKIN